MQYMLKTPVSVTVKGEPTDSEILNVEDPSRNNLEDVSKIMEIAAAAMVAAASSSAQSKSDTPEPEDGDGKIDAKQALMLLKLGGKYSESIKAFDQFLLKYGKFDDVKVESGSLKRMDLKDYNGILGEYFANFCFSEFIQD